MRIFPLFKKAMIENIRDWKVLILGLTFAPLFVFLMYFYMETAEIKMSGRETGIIEVYPSIHDPGCMHVQAAFGKPGFLEADFPARKLHIAQIHRGPVVEKR